MVLLVVKVVTVQCPSSVWLHYVFSDYFNLDSVREFFSVIHFYCLYMYTCVYMYIVWFVYIYICIYIYMCIFIYVLY